MRRLGVDMGEKRIGLALSDAEGFLATPLETLPAPKGEGAVALLADRARREGAEEIVLGHPRRLDGRRGAEAKACERLAEALRAEGFAVVLWDERLTTAEAERHLLGAELSHRKRKERIDAVAAQILLQSYLDARARQGRTPQKP